MIRKIHFVRLEVAKTISRWLKCEFKKITFYGRKIFKIRVFSRTMLEALVQKFFFQTIKNI